MPNVSVLIPARNEQEYLEPLLTRIHHSLHESQISYEAIIVDDKSVDATKRVAQTLSTQFPITVISKKGAVGKGSAILQGFTHCHAPIVAIIDADLQYPPEAIAKLFARVVAGADIVIGERKNPHTHIVRHIFDRLNRVLVGRWLHDLPLDINSGLKVMRSEVLQRIPLKPLPWSLDLELLIKAKQCGYRIETMPVAFTARTPSTHRRRSNHSYISKTLQSLSTAIYHKVTRPLVIPFLESFAREHGNGFHYAGRKFIPHNKLNPHKTALYRLSVRHAALIVLALLALLCAALLNWHATLITIVMVLTTLYFADLLFNLFLIVKSFTNMSAITVTQEELQTSANREWPTYTIFCPLYKEHEVIPQFVTAISKLDYPHDKLQVMLLLEEDDTLTIAKARKMNLPTYFEIVVIPHSLPKTKPKACNYGLTKATGEYVVIYDAEDIPDPLQLKKAIIAFDRSERRVVCMQAKLNFYNSHQNILTRVFTAEYSLWFDLVLTGIQSINSPIPLGGTSNHFKTADLRKMGGWDAFNVTEDCDLGMRLVKQGYRTAILDSTTLEEANSDLMNWFWQRSRWIKGYMQSYIVHMRDFREFLRNWKELHGITFQLIVGGKVLSILINPLMWLLTIIYFVFRPIVGEFIDTLFPPAVFYMAVSSLLFGNFLYLYYYMLGCARRNQDDLIKYALLTPFYWLAMSLAAYLALYKLFTAPHHWAKTKHGLHLKNKQAVAQAVRTVGRALSDERMVRADAYALSEAGSR